VADEEGAVFAVGVGEGADVLVFGVLGDQGAGGGAVVVLVFQEHPATGGEEREGVGEDAAVRVQTVRAAVQSEARLVLGDVPTHAGDFVADLI
jgi:hypothetical protein